MNLINSAGMDQNPKQLLVKVVKLLDRLGIDYILTGGLAVTIWGVPRYTQDADLVIQLQREDIPKLKSGLESLSAFGYVDEAMMTDAFQRNAECNYIDAESGFKVDLWMPKGSPFVSSCFDRRVSVDIDGCSVWLVSPEDLIISKLDWWHRGSHKSEYDVRAVMDGQWKRLDWGYIESWVRRLGFDQELQIAKSFVNRSPL